MKIKQYKNPFSFSVLLHIVVLGFLLVSFTFHSYQPPVIQPDTKIVKAVAVNQQAIEQEIEKIQQEKLAKQQAEQRHLEKLQQQAQAVKQQRIIEQKRLAKLKAEQKRLAKRQQAQIKAAKLAKAKRLAAQKQAAALAAKQKALADKKAAAEKAQQLAEQKRKQELADLMKQQLVMEQKQLQAARSAQAQTIIDKYRAMIIQAISQRWIVPDNVNKNVSCTFLIHVAPGGMVLDVKLLKSSGNPVLDRSAQTAVYKASPLPVPKDPSLFNSFRELNLIVKPEGVA